MWRPMARGIKKLNVVLLSHMVSLDLVLIPRHGRCEPVLGELQLLLPLLVRPRLLLPLRRVDLEELGRQLDLASVPHELVGPVDFLVDARRTAAEEAVFE